MYLSVSLFKQSVRITSFVAKIFVANNFTLRACVYSPAGIRPCYMHIFNQRCIHIPLEYQHSLHHAIRLKRCASC